MFFFRQQIFVGILGNISEFSGGSSRILSAKYEIVIDVKTNKGFFNLHASSIFLAMFGGLDDIEDYYRF